MAEKYYTLSEEAIQKLCGLVRESHSVADAIDDENISTESTYSSKTIENKITDITPTIVEDENNDADTYKLNITTRDGTITTPNLKENNAKTYTSLADLGLTAPVTVGDIYNAMDDKTIAMIACEGTKYHITDIPGYYGILTIKRARVGRFSIEFQSSSGVSATNVKRWIGTLNGTDGTELYWKELITEAVYTALSDLELTADATFQDVIDKLPKGGSALLGVTEFTNYQTIFPYEDGNDQFARVHIVKGVADGSSMYARWFRKDGAKEAIAKFNINTNKFDGWEKVAIRTISTLAELGLTSSATVDDVHDKLAVGQMAILQVRAFDNYQTLFPYADSNDQYARIEIQKGKSTTHSRIFWWRKDGSKFAVGNINSNNKLAGWNEYALKSYVDSKIADLQAQINALK